MYDFNVLLVGLTKCKTLTSHYFSCFDASAIKTSAQKGFELRTQSFGTLCQKNQLLNPDSRISLSDTLSQESLLSEFAECYQGIVTGDLERFRSQFWEVNLEGTSWQPFRTTTSETGKFDGLDAAIYWEEGKGKLHEYAALTRDQLHDMHESGNRAWGRHGVAINRMAELRATHYLGEIFDNNVAVAIPKNHDNLSALMAFCASPDFNDLVRNLDQTLKVTNRTLTKVPFDLQHWQKIAKEDSQRILQKPFTSDPTQWLFKGHPFGADQPLHTAVARLVGYKWPRQYRTSFADCPAIDPDGLETHADEDGIVCIAPIRGEASATDRLRSLLTKAFECEWSTSKERELLLETAVAAGAKKAAADFNDWLRQYFFAEHCKLFKSRPFIWQVWDGNPHGFSALLNYHKLAEPNGQGRKTLELLTYTYLGDWIDRQKLDQAEGVNGADDRLAAALDLQSQLKKILEGEPPYDLFVRWKPLHQQATGWDPDINDGVRLNIRPFLNAQLRKVGKAGAGILRAKPGTIKWKKDRGKEPMRSKDDFPWFWGWDEANISLAIDYGAPISEAPAAGDSFDGNRWNDLHYTRAAKEAARARYRGEG
tara:strand:- start:713 stop:2497 length:1785 start_codon:yes stop_codon:yes gene_type:complete